MPASRLAGHRMISIIHLPAPALDSNATRTADGGRTLVWDTPLAEAVKRPVVSRFKMNIPIPPWAVAAVSLTIAAAAGLLLVYFLRRRRRR